METTYRPRSVRSGVGFPTSSRELAPLPPNRKDPSGYYAFLGLDPWASEREIKERCRYLLRLYHPDGQCPDRGLFERVEMMYRTLGDPVRKVQYDNTPEGQVMLDRELVQELRTKLTPEQIESLLVPDVTTWTYAAIDGVELDEDEVDFWYRLLARVAWELGYQGTIRVEFGSGPGDPPEGWVRVDPETPPSTSAAVEALRAANLTG